MRWMIGCTLCLWMCLPSSYVFGFSYKWKVGAVHRFQYKAVTKFVVHTRRKALTIRTKAVFSLKVMRTRAQRQHRIRMRIHRLKYYANGRSIGGLRLLPKSAHSWEGLVDRSGRIHLEGMLALHVYKDHLYLAVRRGKRAAREDASVYRWRGKMRVYASSHYTKRLRRRRWRKSRLSYVQSTSEEVDLLPTEVLRAVLLPKGGHKLGSTSHRCIRGMNVRNVITSMQKGRVTFKTTSRLRSLQVESCVKKQAPKKQTSKKRLPKRERFIKYLSGISLGNVSGEDSKQKAPRGLGVGGSTIGFGFRMWKLMPKIELRAQSTFDIHKGMLRSVSCHIQQVTYGSGDRVVTKITLSRR